MTNRILVLSSLPLAAPWNGADKNLAAALVRADAQQTFRVHTGPDDLWPGHVLPVRSRHAGAMPTEGQKLREFLYLVRHLRHADLIHIVASLSHPSPWAAGLLRSVALLARRPIVHTIPSVGDRPVGRRHFPGDVNVVVSEHTRRRLRALGVPNVTRSLPPLDWRVLGRGRRPPAALAAELALGPRAVLYPAHYGPDSGIADIIAAFAALPAALGDAVLVLACRARRGDDAAVEAERARTLAAEAGIARRVRVIGDVAEMPALIQACALTALVPLRLASKMDLPLVVLESLALGRPAIVSDRPPLSEALLGEGGLAVPPGEPGALSAALAALLADGGRRARLGAQGQVAVRQQCDPAVVAQRYRRIYAWSRAGRARSAPEDYESSPQPAELAELSEVSELPD